MKRFTYMSLALFMLALTAGSCRREGAPAEHYTAVDSLPMLIMQVRQCARLYTTEYRIHKIVTYDDELRLKGSIFDHDFDLPLPLGDRKVVIPMDATLKGYIDFGDFSSKNVLRHGDHITIVLPDPKVMLTSSKVDQANIREYVSLTRAHFSDKELATYEAQGREAIIASIPQLGIVESAREGAARLLIPLIAQTGFDEAHVRIVFRDDFNPENLKQLLDHNTIERHEQ